MKEIWLTMQRIQPSVEETCFFAVLINNLFIQQLNNGCVVTYVQGHVHVVAVMQTTFNFYLLVIMNELEFINECDPQSIYKLQYYSLHTKHLWDLEIVGVHVHLHVVVEKVFDCCRWRIMVEMSFSDVGAR